MSDASVLEVVVYGDSPDGGGGGTDVISIPADMLTFFEPTGPTIINPPQPPPGGGGTGTPNPKQALEDASDGLFWGGVVLAVVALVPGVGEVVIGGVTLATWAGVGAVLGGVAAHQVDEAADDPPQPEYRRDPVAPERTTTLSPQVRATMGPLLVAEQQMRLFVDSIECAQGAFLAADAPWVQRHTLAASATYRRAGTHLARAADTIEECWTDWRQRLGGAAAPRPATSTGLRRVLRDAATRIGLDADESAKIVDELVEHTGELPARSDLATILAPVHRMASRMATPTMVDARFAFPRPATGARTRS